MQTQDKKYVYYAFISYKHANRYWGKWIQRNMEMYRLPSRLCREQSVPRHVTPIFRDETDLSGGKTVREHLKEKLEQCKYLIVICSREMHRAPEYIDFEINTFLEAGNPASRILPVIVDGEANSKNPEMECLPPALLNMGENMPLGIKLNRKDRKETILKLIAAILELDIQSLREHNHARKQRRIVGALGCGLILSLGLGAFMTWEMLSVKQASLREQLVYAEENFRQGNKISAAIAAEAVAQEYIPLMDQTISEQAEQLSMRAAIRPKYQPLVGLTEAADGSRLMFDSTGEQIMVISDISVEKYDAAGRKLMTFDISQKAHQIIDVCVDGVHAAVLKLPTKGAEQTQVWLWNMIKDQPLQMLVSSEQYDQENEKNGYLDSVVDAVFSPDGKSVCAWRDGAGGYYNESEELTAWDVQTGNKLFSFSAELLGKGNQPYEIRNFEFIDSQTLHWTGSMNHVFYRLGDDEPSVLSNRQMPSVKDKSVVSVGSMRYTLRSENGSAELTDLLTGNTIVCTQAGTNHSYVEIDSRYIVLIDEDAERHFEKLTIIDLNNMAEIPYTEDINRLLKGGTVAINTLEGSRNIYLTKIDDALYRLNLSSGSVLEMELLFGVTYMPVASVGDMDIFMGSFEGRTCILEVEDSGLREYCVDEDYDLFSASAVFSQSGYMAANHDDTYFLYPAVHPGVQLDAGDPCDPEAVYAASSDGRMLVKGSENVITAWKNGQRLMQVSLDDPVLQVQIADNGRFVAVTRYTLYLYSAQGELIATKKAEETSAFHSAKFSRDGKRILLLEGSNSFYAGNACQLVLLNGEDLTRIGLISDQVHVVDAGVYETAYDISVDGRWIAAVVRSPVRQDTSYKPYVCLWSAEDGSLVAKTQSEYVVPDIPVFSLEGGLGDEASKYLLQYVKFARNGKLLCGLQYGTWILNVEQLVTEDYVAEGVRIDAMPDMLSSGQLIYPANGIHVWNMKTGSFEAKKEHHTPISRINAMLLRANQNRIYISPDQQWIAVSGSDDTWLYNTQDWSVGMELVSQRAQILYLDDTQMVYATNDGLWRLVYGKDEKEELK